MARYPESFIHQVQQATDIVELVGQYVALKKRGKEFVGLCPFHDDNRPSLNVSATKQIFKCFACGAGGGVFQFLMQSQKVTFPEAVRELAGRAGIPLPAVATSPDADRSLSPEVLTELCTFAARFFRDQLFSEAGLKALTYARGRKLSDESIRRFGLGFAPDSWEALHAAAGGAGFSDRQLVSAGLVSQRDDGSCYDRFRNRLIFPIFNVAGKVVAFGGRVLADDQQPKYLNSPETVLFDKSANLYGLNWARQEIARSEQAVVVEGYLDALMCHQAAISNVVATLGTALTERHVRILSRYSRDVVLLFDADAAGERAAVRTIELFLTQRLNVRIATVPQVQGREVKDPCDYVLAAGAEAMKKLVTEAPDSLAYAWSRRSADYSRAETLAEKRTIVEDFLRLVVSSATYGVIDALRQGLLAGHIAELVGLSPREIADQMRSLARQVGRAGATGRVGASERAVGFSARAERWVLEVLLNAPELFGQVRGRITPAMFGDPALRAVAEEVWRLGEADRLELAAVLGASDSERWGRLVTDLQITGEKRGNHESTLAEATEDFHRRQRREELQNLKEQGDTDKVALMRKIAEHARQPDPRRRPRLS